jgi:hypothetical protein
MSNTRTIRLQLWEMDFDNNFNLNGRATIRIRGATNGGQGQIHEIRFEADECDLARFAQDIRAKFLALRNYRMSRDKENLEVFKADQ